MTGYFTGSYIREGGNTSSKCDVETEIFVNTKKLGKAYGHVVHTMSISAVRVKGVT